MKVKVTSLYKASCAVFTIYYTVIMMVYTSLRGYLLPLGAVMVALFLLVLVKTKPTYKDVLSTPIKSWFAFTIIELGASFFVASNVSYAMVSLISFLELVIMCMCLTYVSIIDGNADFLIKIMYVESLLYVFFMLSTGNTIGGRLALVNANADANVCLIGIVTGSFLINKDKKVKRLLILLSMIPMMYANLMTGSRKSLFCMVFYIVFWVFAELRTTWKTLKTAEKLGILIAFVLVVFLFVKVGIPFFYTSSTYMRMTDSYVLDSDAGRLSLYKEAWNHFVSHPIFGIGFNNFRLYNARGLYSHSTYAEILACCGITGVILFFVPHIWMVVKLIEFLRTDTTFEDKKKTLLMLIYVASSLFLAAGMVQTSNERVLMMYSVVFGYIISKKKFLEGRITYEK